ncbi:hypothetical protein DICPUDRAFT_47947 [Dictyostelium purpureum]|uniref:PA14 domain-containing protein n=1 Tax=Dictyostelium purpureum TaxID=5786 RepID=F0ZM43_DICPU|nr:uncharacterized protein DICPUDRAFT_47947 [Dictyostelium purpureum]EGC34961.1 hypothetical protein DICPUDRAFT_47947 [Dictyostelium purpureum]|eukprot:XP_003288486.1 hypothetical protein DICPUDRAFT_47947 [Dictyostelium purpureum]
MYYNTIFLKTFALLCMVVAIYADSKQPTLTLKGQIFDQHPFFNNNFEPAGGSLRVGLVNPQIDTLHRVPVLRSLDKNNQVNKDGRMITPEYFQYFFSSNNGAPVTANSGRNEVVYFDVVLNWDDQKGVYVYNNQKFFPINNKGFDASKSYQGIELKRYSDGSNYQNFHFCLKVNSKFTYSGYEIFDFTGDDDVYVFINDVLVVDLGGLHTSESKSVSLSTLKLNKGQTYNFDFFYCERHTTASTIKISTNIEVYCPWEDYCGACQGDGSNCCNENVCNDSDPCTIDICPPPQTVIAPGKKISDYCTHVYDTNFCSAQENACVSLKCEKQVAPNVTVCPLSQADIDNCYEAVNCDPVKGCGKKFKCDYGFYNCNTGKCDGKGNCVKKTDEFCYDEQQSYCQDYTCQEGKGCVIKGLRCPVNVSEPCYEYKCDYATGACSTIKIPDDLCTGCCSVNDYTKCQVAFCEDGHCKPKNKVDLPDYDDNNPCTINTCDELTGNMVYTPIKCGGCELCNRKNGQCEPNNSLCSVTNNCTLPNCVHIGNKDDVPTGECQNKEKQCGQDDPDKCKVWKCNADSTNEDNCEFEPVVCPPKGNCLVGACDSGSGECVYSNRVCESPAFCIVAECSEAVGCVTYDRRCDADDGRCQRGVCYNETETEKGRCESVDYDPKPFICKTAAVVSTAVIAGVTVAGAVALAAFIYGGKKGYDYWKEHNGVKFSASTSNPLYVESPNGGVNPLYANGAE